MRTQQVPAPAAKHDISDACGPSPGLSELDWSQRAQRAVRKRYSWRWPFVTAVDCECACNRVYSRQRVTAPTACACGGQHRRTVCITSIPRLRRCESWACRAQASPSAHCSLRTSTAVRRACTSQPAGSPWGQQQAIAAHARHGSCVANEKRQHKRRQARNRNHLTK